MRNSKRKNTPKAVPSPLNDELREALSRGGIWDKKTSAHAGVKDTMIQYFVVLPIQAKVPTQRDLQIIGNCISCLLFDHAMSLKKAEVAVDYMLLSILISPDEALAEFITAFIAQCMHNDVAMDGRCLITSTNRPTSNEIAEFLEEEEEEW